MTVQTPIPDFAAARLAMVESQLRPQGVTDRGVLDAMGAIARERFVPERCSGPCLRRPRFAFGWRPFPDRSERPWPAPDRDGSGCRPARARRRRRHRLFGGGARRDRARGRRGRKLAGARRARSRRGRRGRSGPAQDGFAKGAPYEQILIDGAVEVIPEPIIEQLADGGRLGAALIDRGITRLVVGRKAGIAFGYLSIADAGAPLLPGFTPPPAFTF